MPGNFTTERPVASNFGSAHSVLKHSAHFLRAGPSIAFKKKMKLLPVTFIAIAAIAANINEANAGKLSTGWDGLLFTRV